jgi:hypothetical protein
MVEPAEPPVTEHYDFVTQICGKLQDMGGKNKNMIRPDFTEKLFDFQGHHHVEGGKRLVQ